jgi:Cof subfamily protein (haloacid dehalogenase superfamily)
VNLPYRVVATDLDGTAVRSDGTVSGRTRRAIAQAEDAGATVVFVTGRPPRWMAPVAEATGHRGLAICANGAFVYDLHDERVVEEHLLSPEVARQLTDRLRAELPEVSFAVEWSSRFGHEPGYRPRWPVPADTLVTQVEALLSEPVAKLLARHEGMDADELLVRARAVLGDEVATLTHSSRDGLLEVSAAGVSKATTLAALCRQRGFDAADVIAFGDMPNDLPLLAWAGHSVAVANAHPDVLAAADEVTGSNDEDGVAQVLERLLTRQ